MFADCTAACAIWALGGRTITRFVARFVARIVTVWMVVDNQPKHALGIEPAPAVNPVRKNAATARALDAKIGRRQLGTISIV